MKYLLLTEVEFPDRGSHLLDDDFGKSAKMSDNVSAFNGLTRQRADYNYRFQGVVVPKGGSTLPSLRVTAQIGVSHLPAETWVPGPSSKGLPEVPEAKQTTERE